MKLGQAGFGYFSAEARVSWLKGIFYNNKEVFGRYNLINAGQK